MTIQEALDNYENSRYKDYFDEKPHLISEAEAFDCSDYWITASGEIIACEYSEHQAVIGLLKSLNAIDFEDERDAEINGWIKVSNNQRYITDFPVKKPVKDILLFHFALNGNKWWMCGGRYEFRDAKKLNRWLDGGRYESVEE